MFHGTVTPTVLYACTSWTLTEELENRLRRTQRQMLRMILGAPRRRELAELTHTTTVHDPTSTTNLNTSTTDNTDTHNDDTDSDTTTPRRFPPDDSDITLEPWVDWIRRCTHDVERILTQLGIQDWISIHRQRKSKFANKVATDKHKWSHKALHWDPSTQTHHNPRRRRGHPKTRWDPHRNHDNTQQRQQHNSNTNSNNNSSRSRRSDLETDYVKMTDVETNIVKNNVV